MHICARSAGPACGSCNKKRGVKNEKEESKIILLTLVILLYLPIVKKKSRKLLKMYEVPVCVHIFFRGFTFSQIIDTIQKMC